MNRVRPTANDDKLMTTGPPDLKRPSRRSAKGPPTRCFLVAGVHDHQAPSGYKPTKLLFMASALCSGPGAGLLKYARCQVKVPRNALCMPELTETFGLVTRSWAGVGEYPINRGTDAIGKVPLVP
jgi:hypothetical protein